MCSGVHRVYTLCDCLQHVCYAPILYVFLDCTTRLCFVSKAIHVSTLVFVSVLCTSLPVLFWPCLSVYVTPGYRLKSLYEQSFYLVSLVRKGSRKWLVNLSGNNRVSCVSIAFYNMNHTSLPAHLSCFCLPCITRLKKKNTGSGGLACQETIMFCMMTVNNDNSWRWAVPVSNWRNKTITFALNYCKLGDPPFFFFLCFTTNLFASTSHQ